MPPEKGAGDNPTLPSIVTGGGGEPTRVTPSVLPGRSPKTKYNHECATANPCGVVGVVRRYPGWGKTGVSHATEAGILWVAVFSSSFATGAQDQSYGEIPVTRAMGPYLDQR